MYSLPNRDKLTQPIQVELSQEQKTFSELFRASSKSNLSFEHFETKDGLRSLFICEAKACEKRG